MLALAFETTIGAPPPGWAELSTGSQRTERRPRTLCLAAHSDFYVAHRTGEPDRADAPASVHEVDERILEKTGEPESGRLGVHGVV